jgi:uncharacterized protein
VAAAALTRARPRDYAQPILADIPGVLATGDVAGADAAHEVKTASSRKVIDVRRVRRAHRGGSMAGKFVLTKGSSGKYHFNLVASNGQIIATSETYERKQSALNGIESVKNNAPGAEVDDQTGD